MSPKRLLVIAGIAAGTLSLAAPAAALDKSKVTGTLKFNGPSAFFGKVNSKLDACESGARVNLWRFDGPADTTGDKMGSDKASANGAWEIEVPNAQAGDWQIQIKGRLADAHDEEVKCLLYVGARIAF